MRTFSKNLNFVSIIQAIPTATEHRFDVNTTSVNFLAMIFPILFFPGLLLSSVTMEKYSLRGTMLIASIMMAAGCIVRFAGSVLPSSLEHESFALILIGQSIVALAQPFVLNLPGVIAGRWFGAEERDLATTLGTLSNILGQGSCLHTHTLYFTHSLTHSHSHTHTHIQP